MATTTHAGKSASLLPQLSARLSGALDEAPARLPSKRPHTSHVEWKAARARLAVLVELMREGPGIVALCAFVLGNAFIAYTFLKPWL